MYTSDDLTSCIEGPVILCTCVCMRTDTELFLLILFRVKKQNNNKKKNPKKPTQFLTWSLCAGGDKRSWHHRFCSFPTLCQPENCCCWQFYKELLFQITLWARDKPVSLGGCLTVRSWKWLGNLTVFYLSKKKTKKNPKKPQKTIHSQDKRQISLCCILC